MLNKILATVGIGGARVDARVGPGPHLPGGTLNGEIFVRGGSAEQEIRGLYLRVMTDYEQESDDHKYRVDFTLAEFRIPEAFTLRPNEERGFDFSIHLPASTPVSIGQQKVWLKTGLDIAGAVDSADKDPLQVQPTPLMGRVLSGMEHLGFRLNRANCEKGRGTGVPFVQEFEFKPQGGAYRGRLDEVDVVFHVYDGSLDVLLEVDRKARGLAGFFESAMNMDERYVRVHFDDTDLAYGADAFAQQLDRAIAPHAH